MSRRNCQVERIGWVSWLGSWLGLLILAGTACVFATDGGASDPYTTAVEVDRLLLLEMAGKPGEEASGRTSCVNDETFLRRVFLDLVGSPPTQDEVLTFCLDSDPQKRRNLVTRLLGNADFGSNWAKYWRDVILYRRTEDRALITAPDLTKFLAEQFNKNRPWSETASELITASGETNEKGQTGLIVAQGAVPEEITAEVSRIFLGMQIQCAQCHDHPTDPWKREEFHQMAAFFPRLGMRVNNADLSITVTTTDVEVRRRRDNNNRFFGTLEHYMPDKANPQATGTMMEPVFFLTKQKLPVGTKDVDRRGTLAKWITDAGNPWFAKAFVNRMWLELVGTGFYDSVDDLGPTRTCAAPKTLAFLSQSFSQSGYDTKWLFTTVMATNAYQQSSQGGRPPGDAALVANCAQRLRAEQLLDSIISALNLEGRLPEAANRGGPIALRRDVRFVFNQLFGYDPSEPREDLMATIPQALLLMNSSLLHQAISASRRDSLGGVIARNRDNEAALVELYLNTLGRRPTDKEIAACLEYISTVGDRSEAFEDVLWSLINSTEFTFRR